ncbi:MAG: PRC-barrel domain containing protein [Anaerolineae bacterium]|nr:PRC-barrel domain containing protein [Anaerolineae bacterium]NIN95836.1 PRC-barrel domain containing protein [Anaerolineae bacterium]NIQ78802.1 PRC-barrel domain containing protein [Anaerolineae bacterium]
MAYRAKWRFINRVLARVSASGDHGNWRCGATGEYRNMISAAASNTLRSMRRLQGFTLGATDGDAGKVRDVYFDGEGWAIRHLVVDTGPWILGHRVLISPSVLREPDWESRVLHVTLTRAQVHNSPGVDTHKPVSQQQRSRHHGYHKRPAYWPRTPLLGSGSLTVYPLLLPDSSMMEGNTKSDDTPTERSQADANLRSSREVIGYHIQAKDGEIGHVEDLLFCDRDWLVQHMLVDTRNWLPGRRYLMEVQWIEEVHWEESKVYLSLTRAGVEGVPQHNPDFQFNR